MKNNLLILAAAIAVSCIGPQVPENISKITDGVSQTNCSWGHVDLQPGEEKTLCEIDGPGALTYFYITDGPEFMTDEALVLRIYWDGNDFPSVNVPAADFFGSIAGRPVDWHSKYMAVHISVISRCHSVKGRESL